MIKYIGIFRLVLRCLLVARKENSTGFSTGLTDRSKNLDPTGRSTRPVSISGPTCLLAKQLGEVITRGGVEDTKLEAKAKDTKKIRGQGQPFRGQTLSRPRTGMLEAKAKDTAASVLKKKKNSSKKFFRQSSIYRRSQNF